LGISEQWQMFSGLQKIPGLRQYFAGMLVARQEVLTQSLGFSVSPVGRDMNSASAALQTSTRTTCLALRLAPYSCTVHLTLRMFAIV